MSIGRGRAQALVVCVVLAGLVTVLGVTKPGAAAPLRLPGSALQSPGSSADVPVAALVDDQGAVILGAGPHDTTIVHGVRRTGGASWKATLAKGQIPLGCVGCPDLLVSGLDGSLRLLANVASTPVSLPERLANMIGIQGLAPVQQDTALATAASPGSVRVLLLGTADAGDRIRHDSGVLLPLTTFQQSRAVLSVSADGTTAASIATEDVLRPGEWRIVVARGQKVLASRIIEAYVRDPTQPPQAATCLSPDGSRVAFVTQSKDDQGILTGPAGGPLVPMRIPGLGRPQSCDIERDRIRVAWFDDQNALRITEADFSGRLRGTAGPFRDSIDSVQLCHGTGTAVLQNAHGTVIVRPGKRPERIGSTSLSGCTTSGTPWVVGGRRVSWFKTS